MDYTQNIDIQQTQTGYTLTVTNIIDEQESTTTVDFATEADLQAYVYAEIDQALARQVIAEQQATKWAANVQAWQRELNSVNANGYFAERRPQLIIWMQQYHWRYRAPGEAAVDCELLTNGFLRAIEQPRNVFRLTPDNRRKLEGNQLGGQRFEMLSADQEFWRGKDAEGNTHILRKIQKK